jgi:uncharacterized protein (TIGR04141 family)
MTGYSRSRSTRSIQAGPTTRGVGKLQSVSFIVTYTSLISSSGNRAATIVNARLSLSGRDRGALVDEAKIGMTIHLLKPDGVVSFDDELKKRSQDIRPLAAPLDGEFIPITSQPGEPPWVEAIRSALRNPNGLTLDSQSPAGLLVVRRSGNTFVLSFGHAWQKLQPQWIEPDFGLKVALNAIPRNKLIEIRAEQVFAKSHIASERAPRASFIEEFGVDFDRDFLGALEGIPTNKDLGSHIRGGTNLRLQLPISRLGGTLDRAIRLFQSTAYKQRWPEVGNVNPVRDAKTVVRLDAQFDAELGSPQAFKRLVLFTPAERRDSETQIAHSYVFGHMTGKPVYRPYLLTESWISFLNEKNLAPTVAEARKNRVHLLDEAKEEFNDYFVYDCFGYEMTFEGRPHVLSSGTWYEVVPTFVDHINRYISRIQGPPVGLPSWNQGNHVEKEPEYNNRCGGAPGFLHFDSADILFGGGKSRFEFCDFMHVNSKTLYFAKIASKSSAMSHLVEQVRRTAELLFSTDGGYRAELTKAFKKYHPTADTNWLKSRPENGEWNLCMVSLGRAAAKLPFFAKCSLWRVHKSLTERGHKMFFVAV